MVERYQRKEGINPGNVAEAPKLNPNAVNIPDYGNFLGQLAQFNEKIQDKLDKKTADAALKAGALAGLRADYKPMEGDTIAAEAYNRAGNEIFLNQTLTDTSMRMNTLANDPGLLNDPIAMQGAMSDLRDEIAKNLPLNLIPDFVQQYNNRAVGYITKAQENNIKAVMDKNAVTSLQARREARKGVLENSFNGNFIAAAEDFKNYTESTLGQVGITIEPETALKEIEETRKNMVIQQGYGSISRALPQERAAIISALAADGSDFRKQFSPEDWPTVFADLQAQMVAGSKAEDAAAEEYNAQQKEEARQRMINAVLTKDQAALQLLMDEAETNPNISPSELRTTIEYVNSAGGKGNPALAASIERAIIDGRGAEADKLLLDSRGELSPEEIDKISERRQEQASGYFDELTKNPEFKRIVSDLDKKYADAGWTPGSYKWTKEGQEVYDQILESGLQQITSFKEDPTKGPPKLWSEYERIRATKEQKQAEAAKGNLKVMIERGGRPKPVAIPPQYVQDPAQYEQDIINGTIPKNSDLNSIEVKKQMIKLKLDAEEAAKKANSVAPKAGGPAPLSLDAIPPENRTDEQVTLEQMGISPLGAQQLEEK